MCLTLETSTRRDIPSRNSENMEHASQSGMKRSGSSSRIAFEPDLHPVIARAFNFLKSQEGREQFELSGLVVALRRAQAEVQGRVTLLASLPPKGQRRQVSLVLDLDN
jgi:hypothetical protein